MKAQYTGEELNNLGLNEAINKPSDVENINKKLSDITLVQLCLVELEQNVCDLATLKKVICLIGLLAIRKQRSVLSHKLCVHRNENIVRYQIKDMYERYHQNLYDKQSFEALDT